MLSLKPTMSLDPSIVAHGLSNFPRRPTTNMEATVQTTVMPMTAYPGFLWLPLVESRIRKSAAETLHSPMATM